jgi:diguanylate cyclase (GGDEF)-like protein
VRSLSRQVSKTHQRAITDPLTRLYNFGFFRERVSLEVDRAAQTGDLVSLVMFDIDHFKHYNDNNGHEEGNAALTTVADIIKATGRRGDIVARYGGEEFVVLLRNPTPEVAFDVGERVRAAVAALDLQRLGVRAVSVSVGVAVARRADQSIDDLIEQADRALYRAKRSGRDKVVAA